MLKVHSFEFNLFGVRTCLVWDTASLECAVIDPGMSNQREESEFDRFIDENRLKVTHLINTHLHIDHTLGNDYVESRFNLPLEANSGDAFLGQQRDGQARMFNLRLPSLKPLVIGVDLSEGDKIKLGEEYLEVLEVPGHSPGSIVLYAPVEHFMIAGDVLFQGSIGRTDLPGGSMRTLVEGIRSKLLPLPSDTIVYPGHGPATTIGRERSSNPYFG